MQFVNDDNKNIKIAHEISRLKGFEIRIFEKSKLINFTVTNRYKLHTPPNSYISTILQHKV